LADLAVLFGKANCGSTNTKMHQTIDLQQNVNNFSTTAVHTIRLYLQHVIAIAKWL